VGDGKTFWNARYLTAKTERGFYISRQHVLNGISVTKTHLIPRWGSTILQSMNHADINKWILALFKEKKYASSTINKMLIRLQIVLDFAVLDGFIPENPAKKVRPVKLTQKDRGSLTMGEASLLLQESNWPEELFPFYVATVLGTACGFRLSEVRGLLDTRVHEKYIDIVAKWEGDRKDGYVERTKSGKGRAVTITPALHRLLDRLTQLSAGRSKLGLLFITARGTLFGDVPPASKTFNLHFSNALRRIGIAASQQKSRNLSFHSLRHTFVSLNYVAGMNPEKLRLITGHADIDTQLNYVHSRPGDFVEITQMQESMMGKSLVASS
jgi:integrase